MNISTWLTASTAQLKEAGIPTARLDALVLLEDATGKDRAWLLAHPETPLTSPLLQGAALQMLESQVERRATHEPLAYIRGKTEFYGREFIIDHRVLEPRPESETIIDLLKELAQTSRHPEQSAMSAHVSESPQKRIATGDTNSTGSLNQVQGKFSTKSRMTQQQGQLVIADIGTGSGMLAITAKLELPNAQVYAVDIDKNCLDVARKNAKKHSVKIEFAKGDLLAPLTTNFKLQTTNLILLCNLPYVPDNFQINPAAMREPRIAIFGGMDGLNVYRKLFGQIDGLQNKPLFILTESLPPQHHYLAEIARRHQYIQENKNDFIQLFASE